MLDELFHAEGLSCSAYFGRAVSGGYANFLVQIMGSFNTASTFSTSSSQSRPSKKEMDSLRSWPMPKWLKYLDQIYESQIVILKPCDRRDCASEPRKRTSWSKILFSTELARLNGGQHRLARSGHGRYHASHDIAIVAVARKERMKQGIPDCRSRLLPDEQRPVERVKSTETQKVSVVPEIEVIFKKSLSK